MKNVYVKLVRVEDVAKMEKLLNVYRVGLNDWDKTRVLNYQGVDLVNYTIICTQDIYNAIDTAMESC